MKFHKAPIAGAFMIELEPYLDDRGFFVEALVRDELEKAGLRFDIRRVNIARSDRAGTLRGLHWQAHPWAQGKIVYATAGKIFDAIVDVRRESGTYGMSFSGDLVPGVNGLFIPRGVAHGWQALEDGSQILYLVDNDYMPSHERGLRYDDPDAGIKWPLPPVMVAARDLGWPTFKEL